MNKPTDYKCIAKWGTDLQSFPYYIAIQQEKAARDNAPLTATFKREDGTWATASVEDLQRWGLNEKGL